MPTVSWSQIKTFRRCMKAHDYKYHQRLKPKKKSIPLVKGSILHEMLDAYHRSQTIPNYQGEDAGQILDRYEEDYRDLFLEEQEKYGDVIGDCETIFSNYLRFYRNDNLTYTSSEGMISTELIDGVTLIGYIDKVATDDKGRRWLVDHKFVKNIPQEDEMYHELQLLVYVWGWERYVHGGNGEHKIDGIIWDHARTKIPTKPKLLKSGAMSVAKNIDTTPRAIMGAIAEYGLDPADYVDFIQHYEGNEERYFQRTILPRPPQAMIDQVVSDFRESASMIQHMKGIAPRSMTTMNCKMCEFRSLCEAEVRGHDADFIKKADYTQREEHGDDYDAPEEDI